MKKTLFFLAALMMLPLTALSYEVRDARAVIGERPSQVTFSWKVADNAYNVEQDAYEISVAASAKDLKKGKYVWTTGKVESGESLYVPYTGGELGRGCEYYWKITSWAGKSKASATGVWRNGLAPEDWSDASWIGISDRDAVKYDEKYRMTLVARYARKEFNLSSKVKKATLYVCGLGNSECYINGEKVSDDIFGPLPTWYPTSVVYLTYDVTGMLKKGANAFGALLSNGRYAGPRQSSTQFFGVPRMIARLVVEYAGGKTETIVTDGSWSVTKQGPVRENNEYEGEVYDARMEMGDWTLPGYKETSIWSPADILDAPGGVMRAQNSPSLKVMETIRPVNVYRAGEGRVIVDMGQNMVGWLKVSLKGVKDSTVVMKFSEILEPKDSCQLSVANFRTSIVVDKYTAARDGMFTWEPTTVYHGFRYAEISGIDYVPEVSDFEGKVIYDEMATTGHFECSDDVMNAVYKNAYWGIRGNYRGMPTDCPQRDERVGWLGDRAMVCYGESYIFDNQYLYNKWLLDIEETMREDGNISMVAPRFWVYYNDQVTWSSCFVNATDMVYTHFGNAQAVKDRYPALKKWMEYVKNNLIEGDIILKDRYGDWCAATPPVPAMPQFARPDGAKRPTPEEMAAFAARQKAAGNAAPNGNMGQGGNRGPQQQGPRRPRDPSRSVSRPVLSTTVGYSLLKKMEKFANIAGYPEDAAEYAELARKMKAAYIEKYYHEDFGGFDGNSVVANVLSLYLGLAPEGAESRIMDNIVVKTDTLWKNHVSGGVVGMQNLMRCLTEYGRPDLAVTIAGQDTYPSWGYMIKKGATTIWEHWNGDTARPGMNSFNHVMLLGDLIIWYYENLAGIKPDPSVPGFKKIIMAPAFPENLSHAAATHDSPYGTISSDWTVTDGALDWTIEVPCNTTATVRVPARFKASIYPAAKSSTVAGDYVEYVVGSGKYTVK